MANTPCKLEHARTWPHGIQRIALLIPSYRRPCPCRCSATGGIDHSVFIRRADRLVAGGVRSEPGRTAFSALRSSSHPIGDLVLAAAARLAASIILFLFGGLIVSLLAE